MKCVICKKGETKAGTATVTLDKDGATLVFKGVPARVCTNCGEEYVDENITASLLRSAAAGELKLFIYESHRRNSRYDVLQPESSRGAITCRAQMCYARSREAGSIFNEPIGL